MFTSLLSLHWSHIIRTLVDEYLLEKSIIKEYLGREVYSPVKNNDNNDRYNSDIFVLNGKTYL